jgi:hypothetical protein
MSEEEQYFTGFAPGKQHNHAIKLGQNFIVIHLLPTLKQLEGYVEKYGGEPDDHLLCIPESAFVTKGSFEFLLADLKYNQWTRVRAVSPEIAVERRHEAHDQWESRINGSPSWQEVVNYDWDTQAEEREWIIAGHDINEYEGEESWAS